MESRCAGGGSVQQRGGPRTLVVATAVVCLGVAAAALAALAFLSLASSPSPSSSGGAFSDLESALLLLRARRSLPPASSVRKTSGAMGDLFCGDSVVECGVWLNKLFPLR